jgi:hypothetical protein
MAFSRVFFFTKLFRPCGFEVLFQRREGPVRSPLDGRYGDKFTFW